MLQVPSARETRGTVPRPLWAGDESATECTEPLGADGYWRALGGVAVPACGNDRSEARQALRQLQRRPLA